MSFPLAGNARIRGALTAAIESGRLPHAILIEGEKGTGRPPFARVKISPAASAAAVGWSMRAHTPIFGR